VSLLVVFRLLARVYTRRQARHKTRVVNQRKIEYGQSEPAVSVFIGLLFILKAIVHSDANSFIMGGLI